MTSLITDLPDKINWGDTTPFILPVTSGRVIKCYDGDTITIAYKIENNDTIFRSSIRLGGIDCPEMRSQNKEEKQCALLAKKKVQELILGKIVTLKNIQSEKYGRTLADVYFMDNEQSVKLNDILINERLAVPYSGETKKSPINWLDYHENKLGD